MSNTTEKFSKLRFKKFLLDLVTWKDLEIVAICCMMGTEIRMEGMAN